MSIPITRHIVVLAQAGIVCGGCQSRDVACTRDLMCYGHSPDFGLLELGRGSAVLLTSLNQYSMSL